LFLSFPLAAKRPIRKLLRRTGPPVQIAKIGWMGLLADARLTRADASPVRGGHPFVKIFGFLLLLAGWGLVLAALALLAANVPRAIFVLAGVCVELVGLTLVMRAHLVSQGARE
jgi:hypothetical protein